MRKPHGRLYNSRPWRPTKRRDWLGWIEEREPLISYANLGGTVGDARETEPDVASLARLSLGEVGTVDSDLWSSIAWHATDFGGIGKWLWTYAFGTTDVEETTTIYPVSE